MGGASTGAPATYTSRRTTGITDPNALVVFEDVTDKTALASFRHRSGGAAKDYILETPSGGAAIFDYDRDGKLDVRGLPVCPVGRIAHATGDAARRKCAAALIGTALAAVLAGGCGRHAFKVKWRVPIAHWVLLLLCLSLFVWSAIGVNDRFTWFLEAFPVMLGIPLLILLYRRFFFFKLG